MFAAVDFVIIIMIMIIYNIGAASVWSHESTAAQYNIMIETYIKYYNNLFLPHIP